MPTVPTTVRQVCQQARAAAAVTRELNATAKDAVLVRLAHAIDGTQYVPSWRCPILSAR